MGKSLVKIPDCMKREKLVRSNTNKMSPRMAVIMHITPRIVHVQSLPRIPDPHDAPLNLLLPNFCKLGLFLS